MICYIESLVLFLLLHPQFFWRSEERSRRTVVSAAIKLEQRLLCGSPPEEPQGRAFLSLASLRAVPCTQLNYLAGCWGEYLNQNTGLDQARVT